MAKRKRRVFTDEFKADAVRPCKAGGRSIGQVATDLDIGETGLRAWLKQTEEAVAVDGSPAGALTTAGQLHEHQGRHLSQSELQRLAQPFCVQRESWPGRLLRRKF
jgi:transposase-like protein